VICIHLKNKDPYFCLAIEEYLLKNFDDDIFMLWQSENTVVVGKHQNALAEINYPFVRKNNIKVARRISGGGTVFHDAGNVNFVFIKNVSSPAAISFKIFTQPVISALSNLGIQATTSGKNDLLIDDLKISGNAEHIYKNRVLHHGTLLFDTDLQNLGQAINVTPGKYESNAVQSNRSPVTNISNHLKKNISVDDFIQFLIGSQLHESANSTFELSDKDIAIIEKLVKEKFETWEWNFGYSPRYNFTNIFYKGNKKAIIKLKVIKGKIEFCELSGNYFSINEMNNLEKKLVGMQHQFDIIQNVLEKSMVDIPEDLTNAFF
jgi:lipoate-protein ligase A